MVTWGIFWGAVLGLMWPNSGGEGWFLGALLGLVGGFSLRWAVRGELKSAQAKQQAQIQLPMPQQVRAAPGGPGSADPAIRASIPGQLLPQGALPPAAISAADNETQGAPAPQASTNRQLPMQALQPLLAGCPTATSRPAPPGWSRCCWQTACGAASARPICGVLPGRGSCCWSAPWRC